MSFVNKDGLKRILTKLKTLIDSKADKNHTHNYAGSSSAGGAATSANKLTTARTIGLTTGVNATAQSFDGSENIAIPVNSIKEAYLEWGGKNFAGSYGPIDAAMVPTLGANRFAFMPPDSIKVEYSTDGGSTWVAYPTGNDAKINLFNDIGACFTIGDSTASKIDKSKYQVRITITTDIANVYTNLNKFVIYCSTNGSTGSWCTIDAKTKADVDSGADTWHVFANKVEINGWSGYNVINTPGIMTYGNRGYQYQKLRFTFGVTSHANTVQYPGLSIIKILGFGGVGWTTPSNMANNGHMYSWDSGQNVTFPAQVTATQFKGPVKNGNYGMKVDSGGYILPVGNTWIGKSDAQWDTAYIKNLKGNADTATKATNADTVPSITNTEIDTLLTNAFK